MAAESDDTGNKLVFRGGGGGGGGGGGERMERFDPWLQNQLQISTQADLFIHL